MLLVVTHNTQIIVQNYAILSIYTNKTNIFLVLHAN